MKNPTELALVRGWIQGLNVVGKGKAQRQVPIAQRLIDEINAHLRDRQLKPIG